MTMLVMILTILASIESTYMTSY